MSINRDGTQLAAAGKTGVTLYNSISKRWKIFGDRNQERAIQCCALSWYKHVVIIASHHPETSPNQYELLFYPKTHLDQSSLLLRHSMPQKRKPLFMDCNDSFLIIFTTDSYFYEYTILPDYNNNEGKVDFNSYHRNILILDLLLELVSIRLQLMSQVSMSSYVTSSPLSFTLLPSEINSTRRYNPISLHFFN